MNKNLFLFILSFLALSGSVIGQTFNAAGLPIAIPDASNGNCASPPSTLNAAVVVSGLSGTVASSDEVQVSVNIAHVWGGDIVVGIIPPGGSEIIIINRVGACQNQNDWFAANTISIRQNASANVPTNFAAGTYLPTQSTLSGVTNPFTLGSLASLVGASRNGTWNVVVHDGSSGDLGTLHAASITFFTAPSCTNPTAYNVTGGGAYCTGGAGVAVGLDNSETGVNYQLQLDGVDDGSLIAGTTGSPISFGTKTAVGIYTVVATTAVGGCTQNMTGSVAISITPTPPAPSITAINYTPCGGTQVTLTAVPPTGYTGAEYLWSKNGTPVNYQNGGPGTYTINAGTVAASNDYTLQVVYAGSTCISLPSAAATIVTSVPVATINPNGPTSFCAGTPTTLNANTGMSSYTWKRGGSIVQVGGNYYVPTVTGNHRVIVTNALGCSQASEWVSVTVNALPVANAGTDKLVCLGSSVQIGSANNAANTYSWLPITGLNNPYISNPIAAATPMTYTVTVTNASTGCSKTDAVIVSTIAAPPTPSITSTPSGSMVNLTVNSPNATSVNWYKNGALLFSNKAPNSSILVAPSSPTQAYTAKSKGTNGCLSSFSNVINTRIGDDKGGDEVIAIEDAMQAYPNPTNGLLNIAISVKDMNTGKLAIYNALGQSVFASDVNLFAGQANIELDMSSFAAGVYTLSFQTENGNYIQKVVKE